MIEKSEKRRRRMVITVLVVLTLVIVGGAVALWWFFSNDLGARPAAKSYGTALYDNTAESYLTKGTEKLPGVVGYLGFPGMEGRFVYAADTATAENADNETTAQTRFATASALNSTAPGNTVLASTDALLTPLTTEEGIKANSGFTLYLPAAPTALRCWPFTTTTPPSRATVLSTSTAAPTCPAITITSASWRASRPAACGIPRWKWGTHPAS